MEKRIKTLYIITIIAILAFLGMQIYWLHTRYEISLKEYEQELGERIVKCVDDYNSIREHANAHPNDTLKPDKKGIVFNIPRFQLDQIYGDTVETKRTATITTYLFSAHELLGIEPGSPLSDEQKMKAAELAQERMIAPADSVVFDASGARDENEAWRATRNVQIERDCPFTEEGIDSVLNKSEIKAKISLTLADSMVWETSKLYDLSLFRPGLSVVLPYSQLEGRIVTIDSDINPFEVFPGMWKTFTASFIVSGFLIVCLVLQISTVRKLSRLDKMRNSFITTMIHELKRPISTLKMCVSGVENEQMMEDREVKRELMTETRNALDNLSAYFSKLRDITFNNVEQIPLNLQNVSLKKLFDSVVSATIAPAGKTVIINNKIDEDIEISADRSHLHNILNNLVENAVKYSGDSVEINAAAEEREGVVELKISDTGNGISSADLRHIFKRFYRGKASSEEQPGMGLGLAYVKLLVEAHGGEITVDSNEGKGTCFTIILPQ
ncbi:MAG: HAMP domain-containing histidine kinase [Muribaculaceae bacterium]|nr:HAMP domain-containing histidine kinase [Muribaculaceae bacterium]